jgi:hypothetical protein
MIVNRIFFIKNIYNIYNIYNIMKALHRYFAVSFILVILLFSLWVTSTMLNGSTLHGMPQNQTCDLQFWYTDDDTKSPVTKISFGSSILVISTGKLNKPNNQIIGNFVQNKLCIIQPDGSALVNNVKTFYLADGNIQFHPVGVQTLNSQGNYGLKSNTTYKFTIINGTEKYLNSTGYVVLHTFDNLERLVKIYFTN